MLETLTATQEQVEKAEPISAHPDKLNKESAGRLKGLFSLFDTFNFNILSQLKNSVCYLWYTFMNNFFYLSSNHESSLRKNHVLESSDIEMNPGPGPEAVQRTESVTMTPTRPELASGQSSSVKLKFHNYCPFEDNLRDNSDLPQTWSAPVLQCFRKCKSAIECIYNVDYIL